MTHRIVTGIACVIISAGTVSFPSYLQDKLAQHEGPMEEIQVTFKKPEKLIYAIILKTCGQPALGKLGNFLDCRDKTMLIWDVE